MPITKYINRLKRMDDLIRRGATGSPDEFARRMGLSNSMLMIYLSEMRKLGAVISYCSERQTYQYLTPCELKFGFKKLSGEKMSLRKGGCDPNYFPIPIILDWHNRGLWNVKLLND